MSDPLSVTAASIGISAFAITSIVQLHSLVTGLSDAFEDVREIASSLGSIKDSLDALNSISAADGRLSEVAKADLDKVGVAESINRCGEACEKISKSIKKWTRHSDPDTMSLRDRFSVGLWNRERMTTFKTLLQSCQTTLMLALNTTQVLSQLRSEQESQTDKDNINKQLQAIERTSQEHLDLAKKQHAGALVRLDELQRGTEDEDENEEQARLLAAKEVQDRKYILEASQVSYTVVHAQARSHRTDQVIGDVLVDESSQAMVGLPASVVGKINQRIGKVTAQKGSKAIVGVFKDDANF